ncbi:MAG TPA: TolC family outer membrane protein [Methylotenera sp.]|nr:TolC family outer membrane protein [Methylotenera sp.]HPH08548.1 TolC family outer membrane protein [Methylotenera sp.]HPM48682.1 TolC family outer membrane protein [Methylotenera sp.]
MNFKLNKIGLLTLLMLADTPIYATETLMSLYQAALQYDAKYKSAAADLNADKEEINKARALFYPKAQLSGSVGRGNTDRTTETQMGDVQTKYNYNTQNLALSVRQPLFNKETMATYKSAQALVKNRQALFQNESSNLITRLASAYFELLYTQEKIAVMTNKIEALSQQLNQASQRYKHGSGTVTEVSEAQAELDIAKADLFEANNFAQAYQLELRNMTGREGIVLAKLNAEKTAAIKTQMGQLQDWLITAQQNNPEILAAQHAVELAEQEVEKKKAGHYPTLDLVGARSFSKNDSNNTLGSEFDSTTVAIQFNLPLFAGGYVDASIRQSIDKVTAAKEELDLKTRETNANIQKYFHHLQNELQAIKAYKQAVKSSETALDGTDKSFKGGLRTNIDVINAQQRLYENKLKLSQSYYVLVNDMVSIQHFAGQLNEAKLQDLNQFFVVN